MTNDAHIKRLSVVSVTPAQPAVEPWEHGVIWHGVDDLVIALGDARWYGQGSLVHQGWPLDTLAQYAAPFVTSDNGSTGLLGILQPFWVTSDGAGILVEGDALTTSFNAPLAGAPPAQSFWDPAPPDQRPQHAAGVETDGVLHIQGRDLTIRFFALENAREVVEAYWSRLTISPPPPAALIEKPLWTTWAHFKNLITHDKVLDYARALVDHGFPCSILGLDAKWQAAFGDARFDPERFPNPQQTVDALHDLGMQVTLWCAPFYNQDSQHYQAVIDQGFAITRADGTPYIGHWWEGEAVFLDVTHPDALRWHLDHYGALAAQVGVDGFKFDAGEGMFYDIPDTIRHSPGPPNHATHIYIAGLAARYPWSDIRAGWNSQGQPMLFRQWDKASTWGFDNGLASCITQAMTLNLLGYPYSFPDMIGGNNYDYGGQRVTAELLIRWTQAVAPMPIIQFSLAPWAYGEDCTRICARYARLHSELAPRNIALADQKVPIVRPLWWLAPTDETALTCADEYLIGDDLLVAPVVVEGARARDIYLPPGAWRSYWDHREAHQGSAWLRDYPAPLDALPLFERISS